MSFALTTTIVADVAEARAIIAAVTTVPASTIAKVVALLDIETMQSLVDPDYGQAFREARVVIDSLDDMPTASKRAAIALLDDAIAKKIKTLHMVTIS